MIIRKIKLAIAKRYVSSFENAVHRMADRKLADGESTTDVALFVGAMIGCPCCGPQWWRDLAVCSYQERGEALPPELAEVSK